MPEGGQIPPPPKPTRVAETKPKPGKDKKPKNA